MKEELSLTEVVYALKKYNTFGEQILQQSIEKYIICERGKLIKQNSPINFDFAGDKMKVDFYVEDKNVAASGGFAGGGNSTH
jgi:hypothetical protein